MTEAGKTPAYIVTGPTSGIGRLTALELAKHGDVVLVGRDKAKLDEMKARIEARGRQAFPIGCDLSDPASAKKAAAEIVKLDLPVAGLLNNAGLKTKHDEKNARGWDLAYATNHLGPFALTEALVPHLADGTNVVFVCSAVEDPERKPAHAAGFRGGRYLSAEACARGEWKPGGSTKGGFDAYATSKQCNLATMLAFARETPRLRFNGLEPGVIVNTGLARGENAFVRWLASTIIPPLVRHRKHFSTPERAARVATEVLLNRTGETGIYYDETGEPMQPSALARDVAFSDRVVAETRAFLARV